jgi:hypothetical protein
MKMNHFAARCAATALVAAVTLSLTSTPARADGQRTSGTIMSDVGPSPNKIIIPDPLPMPTPRPIVIDPKPDREVKPVYPPVRPPVR